MRDCLNIIKPICGKDANGKHQRVAVVVSAMGGKPKVTDLLLDLVHAAAADRLDEIELKTNSILEKHKICVADVLAKSPAIAESILSIIEKDLKDIRDLLRAVQLMKMAHEQILELVSGYGEVWSANIMAALMRQEGLPFIFLNARDVLLVSEHESTGTKVHWEESEAKLNQFIATSQTQFFNSDFGAQFLPTDPNDPVDLPHLMITGYIATTLTGIATTLKRDGSDFSASIFGKLLKANAITIWTDVSGVYSADPRRVPDAQIISEVSYTEAIELAYFGAKVIHPKTMSPAIDAKIPIFIRNTFEPQHEGTRIYLAPPKGQRGRERAVCGFTTVDDISLLNLEGTGMIGVPGIAHRLFGALKTANISVMFIAQASSEHSICFATRSSNAMKARDAIREAFFYELKQGMVSDISVIERCSIIAAVGESMSNMPGVSGLFFTALGGASINVLSISQGCDERNISAVVYSADATRALRAVHSAFWLSSMDISIGLIGTGRVGSAVIQTLLEQCDILNKRFGLNMQIRGIANSRTMMLSDDLAVTMKEQLSPSPESPRSTGSNKMIKMRRNSSNTALSDMQTLLTDPSSGHKEPTDLNKFFEYVKTSSTTPHTIIIDASTSYEVAELHPTWLLHGAHVVTANKRALSNSLSLYNMVYSAMRSSNRMYMSEVTIGASLPIRTTLNDILCSGDAVHSIVGIMSVSSGMVLTDMCDHGLSFTQSLIKTYKQGLFEDDAFLDLEGLEAAHKLLILARELGVAMCIEDIDVEPLASRRPIASWHDLKDEFAAEDASMRERVLQAASRNCTLRYVQRIVCNPAAELGNQRSVAAKASVRLEEVPLDSHQALVKGAVYHFAFHTERYAQNPLIVQGPLSDAANTASGIVGDILRIARSLGAKDKGPEALYHP